MEKDREIKLKHAEGILKLIKAFKITKALVETRIYFGEIKKEHSSILKEIE